MQTASCGVLTSDVHDLLLWTTIDETWGISVSGDINVYEWDLAYYDLCTDAAGTF